MRIVIAPNAFKGSLSALEAATAIGEGIRNAVPDVTRIFIAAESLNRKPEAA